MDKCQNLPEKFLDRLKRLYPEEEYIDVLKSFANKPLPALRTNTLKITTPQLSEKLQQLGFDIEQITWYKDAFILKNKSVRDLTETEPYNDGEFYIQNLSSMIPALVLDPKPDESILDIAAAPGSKTTQIAVMMENRGEIIANDISRKRLYKLHDNLKRYHITNTKVINFRGEALWKKFPGYFNKVLVDVPCTMEGRIRCDDPKTYQDWSPRKIKELSLRQKHILRSAISATKPGGTIVYSTCTLAPEENEEVIDWVLKKAPHEIFIETITIPGISFKGGLSSWNKPFDTQIANTSRIMPSENMEGFFIAKIKII